MRLRTAHCAFHSLPICACVGTKIFHVFQTQIVLLQVCTLTFLHSYVLKHTSGSVICSSNSLRTFSPTLTADSVMHLATFLEGSFHAYSLHNKANMPTSYSVKWQGQLQSCHHLKTWLDLRVGKVARGHEG